MQDPNPLPWGAQDRYQAHFIVKTNLHGNDIDLVAETKLSTTGHFGAKKLVNLEWIGGKIANVLNDDKDLKNMILKQSVKDAYVWIDPTPTGIRIYGKWKSSSEFGISKDLFTIYDRIASHVKELL